MSPMPRPQVTTTTKASPPSPKIIEWQAYEYEYFEKHPNWFWTIGILGLVLAVGAIIFKNILLAALILLADFTVMLYGARRPALINFVLMPRGVRVKDELYPYGDLRSFWVDDESSSKKVILESKKLLMPHLVLPLIDDVHPEEVRQYLLAYLPEERHEDSLSDILGDLFGF